MLTQPGIAILIDCWEYPRTINDIRMLGNQNMYERMLAFIAGTRQIKTVILASHLRYEYMNSDAVWYQNSRNMFHSALELPSSLVESEQHSDSWELNDPNRNRTFHIKTHPTVLNWNPVDSGKFLIAMDREWQLRYYLSQNPELRTAYIFGIAWKQCVHTRPLGVYALSRLSGLKILTHQDFVLSEEYQPVDISSDPEWMPLSDKIYRCRPNWAPHMVK